MKIAAVFWLLLFGLCIRAQTTDSTAVRLQHYKDLYTQKLINMNEYEQLKSHELQIPVGINILPDSVRLRTLQSKFRTQITTGACLVGTGLAISLTTTIIFCLKDPSSYPDGEHKAAYGDIGTIGGGLVMAITGAVFLGIGEHYRNIFYNNYVAINLTGTDNQVGLACKF